MVCFSPIIFSSIGCPHFVAVCGEEHAEGLLHVSFSTTGRSVLYVTTVLSDPIFENTRTFTPTSLLINLENLVSSRRQEKVRKEGKIANFGEKKLRS